MLKVGLVIASAIPSRGRAPVRKWFCRRRDPREARGWSWGAAWRQRRRRGCAFPRLRRWIFRHGVGRKYSSSRKGREKHEEAQKRRHGTKTAKEHGPRIFFVNFCASRGHRSAQVFVAVVVGEVERGGGARAAGGEMSDAREADAGEGTAPRAGEGVMVGAGGEGEDEFVVLAVGESGAEIGVGAAGNGRGIERWLGTRGRERVEVFARPSLTSIMARTTDWWASQAPSARRGVKR